MINDITLEILGANPFPASSLMIQESGTNFELAISPGCVVWRLTAGALGSVFDCRALSILPVAIYFHLLLQKVFLQHLPGSNCPSVTNKLANAKAVIYTGQVMWGLSVLHGLFKVPVLWFALGS